MLIHFANIYYNFFLIFSFIKKNMNIDFCYVLGNYTFGWLHQVDIREASGLMWSWCPNEALISMSWYSCAACARADSVPFYSSIGAVTKLCPSDTICFLDFSKTDEDFWVKLCIQVNRIFSEAYAKFDSKIFIRFREI